MNHRQRLIATLLEQDELGSQGQIVAALAERGIEVTQATVSRDLDRIGAVRIRRNGRTIYARYKDAKIFRTLRASKLYNWYQMFRPDLG